MSLNETSSRINKIRFEGDSTSINYSVRTKSDHGWEEHSLKSPDEPMPEFNDAMLDLAKYVCKICEEPKEHSAKMTVTGVTFSWNDNAMKVVIVAKMPVELSNAPKNITTPIVSLDGEEGEFSEIRASLKTDLDDLQRCAREYIGGVRKEPTQGSIFDGKEEEEEKDAA